MPPLRGVLPADGLGVAVVIERNLRRALAPGEICCGRSRRSDTMNFSCGTIPSKIRPVSGFAGRSRGVGPTARTELMLGGGVSWEFHAPWSVELGFRARVAHFTDSATFSYAGLLQLGIATHFDLLGEP